MGLKTPQKKDIVAGKTIDILNREGLREGKATLIRRSPSKYVEDHLPYIRQDRDPNNDGEGKVYIWTYERWVVEWVLHPRLRKGDRSTVEVNYFQKYGKNPASGYDTEIVPQKTSIRLLFLQPKGTILTPEICCVKDFNKIWRSFKKPEVIVYTHNPLKIKELFDLHNIAARVAGTIDPSTMSFSEGIDSYLREHDWEDFLILLGEDGPETIKEDYVKRIIRSDPSVGLVWK